MTAPPSHDMDAGHLMDSYLQRIATGPEMSKDLELEDARSGMQLILEGKIHPVQAGVFLIALRMKRESDDEFRGILDAIRQSTQFSIASVDDLIDIADPYDGFSRHLPSSPFLPAVLAACGVPAVSHGLNSTGPKFGVTHRQILEAAGIDVDLSPQQAAERISNSQIGWSYVDQSHYNPELHRLVELRNLIVKRSCITTLEVMSGPVRAAGRTHLINGYVHSGYKRIYMDLAKHAGYYSALIIKGMEGGVVPLLNKEVNCISCYDNEDDREYTLDPREAGLLSDIKAVPLPVNPSNDNVDKIKGTNKALAAAAAEEGMKALQGHPGLTRESLIYAAGACLLHIKRFDTIKKATLHAGKVIDNGKALAHFQHG